MNTIHPAPIRRQMDCHVPRVRTLIRMAVRVGDMNHPKPLLTGLLYPQDFFPPAFVRTTPIQGLTKAKGIPPRRLVFTP
jgi:hypothetical protein